ncbi:hypothetical protein [[Clostridium] colinum]|nr:hypothetical protein [[Clostridium] colinum]
MKNIFVEVAFINSDNNVVEKDYNLIEEMYYKIIEDYSKYVNGVIIKKE